MKAIFYTSISLICLSIIAIAITLISYILPGNSKSIEYCMQFKVEYNFEETDYQENYECTKVIETYFNEEVENYMPGYDFDVSTMISFYDEGESHLKMRIWMNSDQITDDNCNNCEAFYDYMKENLSNMINEIIALEIRMNFGPYSTQNFSYGSPILE